MDERASKPGFKRLSGAFCRGPGRAWRAWAAAVTCLILLLGVYAALRFLPQYAKTYDTMEDHFKYGSVRGDLVLGLPYWVWQALPLTCADTLHKVAGGRLPRDYLERVRVYDAGNDGQSAEKRRALAREGYKALGFIYERDGRGQERNLPIGTTQRRSFGVDRVWVNCSVCHSSTFRKDAQDPGTVVLGMPANLFDLYNFEQFIFQCEKSPDFNQLRLMPEIQALGGDLDIIDRYMVYPIAITLMHDLIRFLDSLVGFSAYQPPWGPGRTDTFTNAKSFAGEDWRKSMPDYFKTGKVGRETLGTADFPSIWLQGPRKRRADGRQMELHWDGNNDTVEERNLDAALAAGGLPPVIDHEAIECIEQWLLDLTPPRYPFPIDRKLAAKGAAVYRAYCAECHGRNGRDFEGPKVGYVTDIDDIGTDRYRLDNFTEKLAQNLATFYAGQERNPRPHPCPGGGTYRPPSPASAGKAGPDDYHARLDQIDREEGSYRFKHFHKTRGYANAPLDGLWLRAPYLHNGSVPSLRDLLKPASERPAAFYRGNDLYDPKNVGFVSTEREDSSGRAFFFYDTKVEGNGNQGHEGHKYGTDLPPDEKESLLEYLKTF